MQHKSHHLRILSLEIRSKSLAYSLFDSPADLVDFGMCGSVHADFHRQRVERLLHRYMPDVVVLRKVISASKRDTPSVRQALRNIRLLARQSHVRLVSIEKYQFARVFRLGHRPTKHRIASLLGACFTQLAWYVPSKRKPYVPEDRRMQYFDAAALGLGYLAAQGHQAVVDGLLVEADKRLKC